MQIKRIELTGFKSFCDRVGVNFSSSDITAVVGPNGCGKSNIVDAIRWVMGTQSAKQLRGAAMEDVIFAGSDTRGPLGMAEVTLVLDTTTGRVPAQYAGYNEVSLSRRLYRDGTSEYEIQKVPCRLQDVRDFFLGTGVGHQAYSIIEQGRVAHLVSAKPEVRRHFIEEAAGITKYKERKHKAMLKMESTRQNLLRVGDIVAEIETSMRRLWRAAKRAERFEACRDEVSDLEKWQLSQELMHLRATLALEGTALGSSGEALTSAETKIAERELTLEQRRLALRDKEVELSDRQGAAAALDNKAKLLEAQVEHRRREIEETRRRIEAEAVETERLLEMRTAREAELESLREASAEVERTFAEQQALLDTRQAELDELRERRSTLESRASGAREKVSAADSRLAALQARETTARARLADAERHAGRLAEEREALHARLAEAGREIETLTVRLTEGETRRAKEAEALATAEGRLAELEVEISRVEVELDTLRSERHRSRSRLTTLEEIQKRREGYQEGTRAILAKMDKGGAEGGDKGIHGVLADVLHAPAEYERAVEAVLGEKLSAVVVSDAAVGVRAVSYLKEQQLGRSCFVPLSTTASSASGGVGLDSHSGAVADSNPSILLDPSVRGRMTELVDVQPTYAAAAKHLLKDVVVVDDLMQALKIWDEEVSRGGQTVVTMDGEVVDRQGVITGGSAGEDRGLLAQKREIRELREICADLETEHDRVRAKLLSLKQESAAVGQRAAAGRNAVHQIELEIHGVRKDLDAANGRQAEVRGRAEAAGAELERLRNSIVELSREIELVTAEAAALSATRDQDQAALAGLVAEFSDAAQDQERLQSVVSDAKVLVARAGEQRAAMRRDLTRLEQDIESTGERISTLAETARDGRERIDVLSGEQEAAKEDLLTVSSEALALSTEVNAQAETCARERGEIDELDAELRGLREERRDLRDDREAQRLRVMELEKDIEHRLDRLREEYQIALGELLHEFHTRPLFDDELRERLRHQRKVLESLRQTYNPSARGEYDELSKRFEFLSEQKTDLEEALERLNKAIQKINRTSRKRFRETFEAINEEFERVFPRLFRGGRARLSLEENVDVLDAGVQIIAQPPGKKLQSVELLSGGEKALTAVSLLFAIMRYKPSPFCLLDEVDAPLDDVNVDRYNEIVREMASDTQFILITHNKRTMAMADTLYGVTMEQPGVSKLVGVNLRDAERYAGDDEARKSALGPFAGQGGPTSARRPSASPPAAPAKPN